MHKVLFATAFLFFSFFSAFAQEGSEKMNNFKVNLFSPIVKSGSFFYERKINDRSSAQLGLGFTSYNRDGVKINGIFITPEYRFYMSNSKVALEGFYLAPYLRYQNLKIEDVSDPSYKSKATLSTFGGGVLVGNQWIFRDLISLDIFAGPNYNSGNVKVTDGTDPSIPSTFNGFGARVGVALGITF